ncbi:MAG: gamma carbonic anhydrase family protein [Thermomicrobiales bacterium]|nr:gamma carbonic anhydrase family protein [Thermomicrobiales bacterium]
MGIYSVNGITPKIAPDVFIAPGAVVAGDVEIGAGSSVWFNAVLRGDVAPIRIGERTNVQDGAVLHVDPETPCMVGNDVIIGHNAIVHGTTVGDGVTVGMGAIVLSRSSIGARAVIAAGAVVSEDAVVAPGALMMGVPARERRIMDEEQQARMMDGARRYVENAQLFKSSLIPVEEVETHGR